MSAEVGAGSFGALRWRHRKAAGLTQEAPAERAWLSTIPISTLERGTDQDAKDALALCVETTAASPRGEGPAPRHAMHQRTM